MKQKIIDALKTKYKSFGLSNEAYDRIASATEKTVTKEEEIADAIAKVETMNLIATELQKMRDTEIQKRTDLEREHNDYKAKHPEGTETQQQQQQQEQQPDITKTIQDAVAAAIAPLTAEINTLKSSASAKEALSTARETFFGGDYAKKYTDEANDAWERATELNEATGSKMTAQELSEKATSYFNKAVSRKGVDTSKPFVADTGGDDQKGTLDWSAEKKRLQDAGRLPQDAK